MLSLLLKFMEMRTSISIPLTNVNSPTCFSSGARVIPVSLNLSVWLEGGMPTTGSSLAFKWPTVQEGEIRRSAEINGGSVALGDGRVMRREMSAMIMCENALH